MLVTRGHGGKDSTKRSSSVCALADNEGCRQTWPLRRRVSSRSTFSKRLSAPRRSYSDPSASTYVSLTAFNLPSLFQLHPSFQYYSPSLPSCSSGYPPSLFHSILSLPVRITLNIPTPASTHSRPYTRRHSLPLRGLPRAHSHRTSPSFYPASPILRFPHSSRGSLRTGARVR